MGIVCTRFQWKDVSVRLFIPPIFRRFCSHLTYLVTLALSGSSHKCQALKGESLLVSFPRLPLVKIRKIGDKDPLPSPLILNTQIKKHINPLFKKKTRMSQKAGIIQMQFRLMRGLYPFTVLFWELFSQHWQSF